MMIVMCAHVSRSLRGRLAREGQTMPERRAHEPVPVAREHMSLTVHRANTMPERRAHEPVPVAREHMSLTVHSQYHAGTESSQARPGGVATMDDYVRTCMCGAPGRESDARDPPIDVCSRLSALVCLRAVNGDVCVCVFPSLDCIVEKKVASQRPIVPSSSALPDRYRSEWAAPDGSGGTRTHFSMV